MQQEGVNILLYAGFMKIVPEFFASEFLGVNSHPADLRIKNQEGLPKYIGMSAIKDTIKDENKKICCTCCIVDYSVDAGAILGQSKKVQIFSNDSVNSLHNRLKKEEYSYYKDVIISFCKGEL